jgi:hypothetical protein
MDDPSDFRMQAAEWRSAAKRYGGEVAQALTRAADVLERKAALIEAGAAAARAGMPDTSTGTDAGEHG